ncbi:MAG: hypothetical protein GY816_05180 [Cytophagales bacterium]|nr:hypothetical protein [Cytophagales bacterium]
MINQLEKKEQSLATGMIKEGLRKASTALASILNSPISIKKIDFGVDSMSKFNVADSKSYDLLRTELIGEIQGVCHLIFTQEEIRRIIDTCLPKELYTGAPSELELMELEFITEIDNMVSATIISQFSNILDVEMFGNVPSLHTIKSNEVKEYLEAESNKYNSTLHFKSIFQGEELEVSPHFTWMVQDEFVTKIKDMAVLQ